MKYTIVFNRFILLDASFERVALGVDKNVRKGTADAIFQVALNIVTLRYENFIVVRAKLDTC